MPESVQGLNSGHYISASHVSEQKMNAVIVQGKGIPAPTGSADDSGADEGAQASIATSSDSTVAPAGSTYIISLVQMLYTPSADTETRTPK